MRSLSERLRAFEQQKARLVDAEAKLKLAERKARTRRLIETGNLIEKAGLSHLAAEALYGALLSLRSGAEDAKQIEQWSKAGVRALKQDEKTVDSEPILLNFPASLDKEAAASLRSAGFRFNRILRHWEGFANLEVAEELAAAHGGRVQKISYSPEQPSPS